MINTKNEDIIAKYFDLVQNEIKTLISKDKEINPEDIEKFNSEIFNQPDEIKNQIRFYIDKATMNNLDVKNVAKNIYDKFKLQIKNNVFNQDDINDVPNKLLGERKYIKTFEEYSQPNILIKLKEYWKKNTLPFFTKLGYDIDINFQLWSDRGKKDPTQYAGNGLIQIKKDFVNYILKNGDTCAWLIHETAHAIADKIKHIVDGDDEIYPANKTERFTYSCQFKYLREKGISSINELKNDVYFKHEFSGGANNSRTRVPILVLYWNYPDIWIKNPSKIVKELQDLMKKQNEENE